MPRRATRPATTRRADRRRVATPGRRVWPWLVGGLVLIVVGVGLWTLAPESPSHLHARAEAASKARDWPEALKLWRAVNRTPLARSRTYLAEEEACIALDLAGQAERALRRAIAADPSEPRAWRLLLQLVRVEERAWEARRLGEKAYAAAVPSSRPEVLRDATLALLADLPDDQARGALDRWTSADPSDLDARVAKLRRIAMEPRDGDPDRSARIALLTDVLKREPGHIAAREALVEALADAGEPDQGRQVLDAWPQDARDGCYWRLLGRWRLDYDHDPAGAVELFERALAEFPHDWRTYYRLARALRSLGRTDEAKRAAETVGRLRETLDPATLGPRLSADLGQLDNPTSCRDLADLCAHVGLTRLADAWRQEAGLAGVRAATRGDSPSFGQGTGH